MVRQVNNFVSKQPYETPDATVLPTSIDELMLKTLEILRRDILCIMGETARGKLSPQSSTALVSYVKLLTDLREKEKELLDQMSDEQLNALAKTE